MRLRNSQLNVLGASKRKFSPAYLFSSTDQGAWYDPSDINLNWRYNLLTYTEQFDNAAWTKSGSTITANATAAPDETLTADALIETATAGTHQIYRLPGLGVATYTYSVYAKANGRTQFVIDQESGGAARFTLSGSGTAVALGANTVSISSVGNGWYRCSSTYTVTGAFGCYTTLYNGTTTSYTGDGTSGIYLWGAQLQTGSTATTYQQIVTPEISYLTYQLQPVLYQDSAGTTPVTAVEQPVGLMLDKSKELVLGSELVTNGDFSGGTTGWTPQSGITLSIDSGRLKVTTDGTLSTGVQQTISGLVIGKTYLLTWDFTQGNRSTNNVYVAAFAGMPGFGGFTASGPYRYVFTATATSGVFVIRNAGATQQTGDFWFTDNISFKELPGNHAYQSTSASRPVLSARYNLLTKTEQFDDAVWGSINCTITPNVVAAPNGTTTADAITATASDPVLYQIVTIAVGANTASIYVKGSANTIGKTARVWIWYAGTATGTNTPISITLTANWQQVTAPSTATGAGTVLFRVDTPGNFSVNDVFYAWGASLVGPTLTPVPYQRVNTATDYDTVGFLPYLKFDGVDDSLSTNSIDFTATDKITVCAGVRKIGASTGVAIELSSSTNDNNGAFGVYGPDGSNNYTFALKGTLVVNNISGSSYVSPITNVITGVGNISEPSNMLRINGSQIAKLTTSQGTGNFGNYPLYIGSRAGASLRFNGQIYSMVIVGKAVTAGELSSTEQYVNSKTGAY